MSRRIEIDIIRVSGMLLIILCHCLLEKGLAFGKYFNVGVPLFLFVSGYLFGQRQIIDYKSWLSKRLYRILPEYYLFILIYFFVVCFIYARLFLKELGVNILVLQGIFTGYALPNAGHLWFISYILMCYLITPLLQKITNRKTAKECIVIFGFIFFALQIFVVPLRIFGINIQAACFCSYVAGYCFSAYRDVSTDMTEHDRIYNYFKKLFLPSLLLEFLRITFDYNVIPISGGVIINKFFGMLFQWINCLLGIWLFFLLYLLAERLLNIIHSNCLHDFIIVASKYSYTIYIVHQIFVYHDFAVTRFIEPYFIGICIAIFLILLSAFVLDKLSDNIRNALQ